MEGLTELFYHAFLSCHFPLSRRSETDIDDVQGEVGVEEVDLDGETMTSEEGRQGYDLYRVLTHYLFGDSGTDPSCVGAGIGAGIGWIIGVEDLVRGEDRAQGPRVLSN